MSKDIYGQRAYYGWVQSTMADTKQTLTQPQTPKTAKASTSRKKDTRSPEEIFKARFNNEARLMTRRFAGFKQLGNAKKARPTTEQLAKAEKWLRDNVEETIKEMRARLTDPSALKEAARDENFKVI